MNLSWKPGKCPNGIHRKIEGKYYHLVDSQLRTNGETIEVALIDPAFKERDRMQKNIKELERQNESNLQEIERLEAILEDDGRG